jgi:hypothetical protein
MATFIGESVVNVVKISGAATTFSYTVPSGRYAVIKFSHFQTGFNPSIVSISGRLVEVPSSTAVYNFTEPSSELILDAGDSITASNDPTFYGIALEYNKP